MARKPNWKKIEAEFRTGRNPSEIARRYGVSIKDVLARARAEKWERGKQGRSRSPSQAALPVPVSQPSPPPKADPGLEDVRKAHQKSMATLRKLFDNELAELQEMLCHTASFLDEARIEELKAQALASGDTSELLEYFVNATKVRKLNAELLEKLSRTATQIITSERTALGIKDDKGQEGASWDDLLALVQQPTSSPELPANVIEFERRALR